MSWATANTAAFTTAIPDMISAQRSSVGRQVGFCQVRALWPAHAGRPPSRPEVWKLAELFDVACEFMQRAIAYYKTAIL